MDPADWLGDADRVAGLGRRLSGAACPIDRLALYRRTLHPAILGRATAWSPDRPVEIFDRDHGLDLSQGFAASPLERVIAEEITASLTGDEIEDTSGSWAAPLRGLDLSLILFFPLRQGAALAVGTGCRHGFAEPECRLLDRLVAGLVKGAKRPRRLSQ